MKQRFKTVFSFAKKVSIVVLVYFVVFALYSKFTNPNPTGVPIQDPILETRKEIYQAINNPEMNKTKEGKNAIAIYRFSLCSTVGEACTNNPSDGDKYYKDSLMSKVGGLMSTPFENPPASGLYWARDSMQHIGLLPSAYAAEGIGFSKLSPLLTMWKAFRNVAYLLVVLAILAVGFMIMFRVKINPQTVVSLENALPRIFISLILITFSFAIAGFMIDLMYTIILLGISVLAKGDPSLNLGKLQNDFMSPDMSDLFDSMFPSRTGSLTSAPLIGGFVQLSDLGSAIAYVLPSWINDIFKIFGMMIFTHFGLDIIFNKNGFGLATHLGEILNKVDILGTGVGDAPGNVILTWIKLILAGLLIFFSLRWGIGWILGLIIFLTIVLLVFRIFILLFAGYVKILLYVIFSPLYLLANMIPGRNAFSQWFRGLASELSAFPVTIMMLVTARLLVNIYHANSRTSVGTLWTPPFMSNLSAKRLAILVGMGMLFIIPDVIKFTKQKLSGSKGSPISFGLGAFFGAAGAIGGGALGGVGKYGSIMHGLSFAKKNKYVARFLGGEGSAGAHE